MSHPLSRPLRRLLFLGLWLAAGLAHAAQPATFANVVLLQGSAVMNERVPDVDAMADYVKAVEAATADAVAAAPAKQSVGGFIVIAVRPGGQSRVWLDFDALLDLDLRQRILSAARGVKPFEAAKGPVVFALKVALWDGRQTRRVAPVPPEWKRAAKGSPPPEVGELVESLWDE
jgi:hypothetical protein